MKNRPTIVWLYRDLRLSDNSALSWAAARGPVIVLYIEDIAGALGGASKWWLHKALEDLSKNLSKHQTNLLLKRGAPLHILRALIAETGADAVTWARRYEPALAQRDAAILAALKQDGIETKIHMGFLLFEPEQIRSQAGSPFKVFTPFSKACFAAPCPAASLPIPKNLVGFKGPSGDDLAQWQLVPKASQWPEGLARAWKVGEKSAADSLHNFITDALLTYKTMRDRPDMSGTSRLSPYLHYGHISPRQVWHAIQHAQAHSPAVGASAERYLLELLWREFSWHLLCHIPDFTTAPLQKSFTSFPWIQDQVGLKAWQKGMTGYPIVDAGMRELWQTGWMHNRVRMIVASFLIKDLLIDWRDGMAWFWDTLVDADLGSNTASWQWVAGCGADAAPYFRIFNPTLQGEKFDPHGDYVRRYVPELAKLDKNYIHEPWGAPPEALAKSEVILGKTYPHPLIDHAKARQRALHALKVSKGEAGQAPELGDLFD